MNQIKPSIIICVEGGCITHIATEENLIMVRIIDYDNDELEYGDYTPDASGIDIEEHTQNLLKDDYVVVNVK